MSHLGLESSSRAFSNANWWSSDQLNEVFFLRSSLNGMSSVAMSFVKLQI